MLTIRLHDNKCLIYLNTKSNRLVPTLFVSTNLSLDNIIIGYNFIFPSSATQTGFATWVITIILLCFSYAFGK